MKHLIQKSLMKLNREYTVIECFENCIYEKILEKCGCMDFKFKNGVNFCKNISYLICVRNHCEIHLNLNI